MLYIILSAICFVTLAHGAASSSTIHTDASSGKIGSSLHAMDKRLDRPKKTLSFIYYPTGRDIPAGHAEVEVGGTVWNLMRDDHDSRSLEETITSATTRGYPFFRFVLTANSNQKRDIDQYIYESRDSIVCSRAALYPLSKIGATSVPFPINLSPLATALYLKAGAVLGTNNVKRIEYYGNSSNKQSLITMLPGIATETIMNCAAGCAVSCISFFISYALIHIYSNLL